MTGDSSFDRDLERWLKAEAPATGPAGLHAASMDQARGTRQRPGWVVALRSGTFATTPRIARTSALAAYLLVILGLLLAALAVAAAAGALKTDPAKLLTIQTTVPPVATTPSAPAVPVSIDGFGTSGDGMLADATLTSDRFQPRVTFSLPAWPPYGAGATDWCPPHTSNGTIVLGFRPACRATLSLIHPYAVDCGTADAHPDAASLATALLANPRLTGARDLGSLQDPGAVPPRLFLAAYPGRVLRISPSRGGDPGAVDPAHCRLIPESGGADTTVEIRGDRTTSLVLFDVRGDLVVLLVTTPGYDEVPDLPERMLGDIHDITFP